MNPFHPTSAIADPRSSVPQSGCGGGAVGGAKDFAAASTTSRPPLINLTNKEQTLTQRSKSGKRPKASVTQQPKRPSQVSRSSRSGTTSSSSSSSSSTSSATLQIPHHHHHHSRRQQHQYQQRLGVPDDDSDQPPRRRSRISVEPIEEEEDTSEGGLESMEVETPAVNQSVDMSVDAAQEDDEVNVEEGSVHHIFILKSSSNNGSPSSSSPPSASSSSRSCSSSSCSSSSCSCSASLDASPPSRYSSMRSPKPELPPSCNDIDEHDENDPQWVTTYVQSIFDYLNKNEARLRPSPINYMESVQQSLTPAMRGILIDWLVEVAEEYELSSETLFLAVNYLDRFASKNLVDRRKFQLVGVGCMLIASKYEGIVAPAVDEFVYISANTYTREEVLKMETVILASLEFSLTAATAKVFLRRFLKAADADLTLAFLASYLCEITLLDYNFLQYLPSVVAAASVFLALLTLSRSPWTPTLEYYTKSKLQDPVFQRCVRDLHHLQVTVPQGSLRSIYEKYAHKRFESVSQLTPPSMV